MKGRTFDWRFLAMLAFLLMVGYLVLTGVVAIQQNAEKGRQIDALIAASQKADDNAARRQERLTARLDAYDSRQRALLVYLRRHGIDIPTRFIQPVVVGEPSRRPGGGTPGTAPSPQVSPAPPSAPGNSHGHRAKTKKTHKH